MLMQPPPPTPGPPPDVFRDAIWQFIGFVVSTIVGLVAIAVSVYLYIRQKESKALVYDVIANNPLLSQEAMKELGNNLKMEYNNKQIDSLRLIVFRFFNAGNKPIEATEFHLNEPIEISFGNNGEILDKAVLDANPADVGKRVKLASDQNKLQIQPLLLNPGDTFTVKVITTCDQGPVIPTASISGVRQIESVELRRGQAFYVKMRIIWVIGITSIVFGIISVAIAYIWRQLALYAGAFMATTFLVAMLTVALVIFWKRA